MFNYTSYIILKTIDGKFHKIEDVKSNNITSRFKAIKFYNILYISILTQNLIIIGLLINNGIVVVYTYK